MCSGAARSIILGVFTGVLACAADISGEVVVKRKLTRRTVTAPASTYQRGAAVSLPAVVSEDPLVFERTRVVVYLEGDLTTEPATVSVEQLNRRFVPDLIVVPVGSTVAFPNGDQIFHNVFSLSKAKVFDLGNYPKGSSRSVTFAKPGVVYLNCHLHPNMAATIVVTPNRWHARPDAVGKFVLRNVPPGRHTVVAWHKAAGFFRQVVEVTAGRDERVSFLVPFDEDGSALAAKQR